MMKLEDKIDLVAKIKLDLVKLAKDVSFGHKDAKAELDRIFDLSTANMEYWLFLKRKQSKLHGTFDQNYEDEIREKFLTEYSRINDMEWLPNIPTLINKIK